MASFSGQPAGPPARRRGPAIATPPLDTAGAAKTTKRYSFSDTPMEMQAPKFNYPVTSPTNSTIDESPITPASLNSRVLPIYTEPATTHAIVREEKERARSQQPPPPQGVHPAYFAPYREDSQREGQQQGQQYEQEQQQQQQQQKQKQNPQHELHPPTENGTMPGVNITAPTPQTPITPPHSLSSAPPPPPPPAAAAIVNSTYLKPPPAKKTPQTTTTTPSPHSAIVPDTAYPPPPSTTTTTQPPPPKPTWSHPLFSASPSCILSLPLPCLCLPCLTYSKTSHRLSLKSSGRDPTNMLGHDPCNTICVLFGLASVCGVCGVLAAWQRGRVRKVYGIEGDWGGDLLRGCGCCWCVVWGSEREVRGREEEEGGRRERERGGGGGIGGGGQYVSPAGEMVYAPPPRVGR